MKSTEDSVNYKNMDQRSGWPGTHRDIWFNQYTSASLVQLGQEVFGGFTDAHTVTVWADWQVSSK